MSPRTLVKAAKIRKTIWSRLSKSRKLPIGHNSSKRASDDTKNDIETPDPREPFRRMKLSEDVPRPFRNEFDRNSHGEVRSKRPETDASSYQILSQLQVDHPQSVYTLRRKSQTRPKHLQSGRLLYLSMSHLDFKLHE